MSASALNMTLFRCIVGFDIEQQRAHERRHSDTNKVRLLRDLAARSDACVPV